MRAGPCALRLRRRGVGVALAAVLVALVVGCGGDERPIVAGLPWSATFAGDDDGAEFSRPEGSNHGRCTREVRDGAAWYTWVASDPDGAATRCYPTHEFGARGDAGWTTPVREPWRFRGRFLVTLGGDPSRIVNTTFSLITFLPSPPVETPENRNAWRSSTTVNLQWSSAREQVELNIWHVPDQNAGDYERISPIAFPLDTWVELDLEWDARGRIVLRQDGTEVIRAHKRTALDGAGRRLAIGRTELYAAHFGGYASAEVGDWTIANDDLRIEALGAGG